MASDIALAIEERDRLFQTLNEEQRQFLNHMMTRGRRTMFARQLARQKGAIVPEDAPYEEIEHLVDDWIYTGYVDAGRVSKDHPCECGRPLRYQHSVQHKATGEIKRFSEEHLQLHTAIDAKTVSLILKGFQTIDLELAEILHKLSEDWSAERAIGPVPADFQWPEDMRRHLELNLPLLDRQMKRLRIALHEHLNAAAQRRNRPRKEERKSADTSSTDLPGVQTDLFGERMEPDNSPVRPDIEEAVRGFRLPEEYGRAVVSYLKEGVTSSRIICELLIRNENAPDKRFITEKPHLYYPVCLYIEETGLCELVASDAADRVYRWIG